MTIDLSNILNMDVEFTDVPPEYIPEITPVSMNDVDKMPPMDMSIQMSDPCPKCLGFTMVVGDYVCWGFCYHCYDTELERHMLLRLSDPY